MAELNFGLLTPPGSQSIGNAFVQGMDQAAVARAQENQNALSQYTLSKARREDAQQNELYAAVRQPGFKLDIGTAMRFGAPGLAAYKAQEEAATRGVDFQIKQETLRGLPNKRLLDESNLIDKSLSRYQSQVATVQAAPAVAAYVRQTYADPVLNPYLTKIKSEEDAIAENVAQFNANPDKWRATHTNVHGLQILQATMPKPQVVGSTIANMNPMAGQVGAPIPGAPPVSNQAKDLLIPGPGGTLVPNKALIDVKTGLNRAGAPNVSVRTEQAYSGAVATGAAKQDLAQIDRAQNLPQDFAKIDETLNILRNTDINTGLGADLFTVLDKARSHVAADKKAGKRAVNTEYLDSLLGSAVFPQIQALGIGARGMDTPAEREFLRKVMTGTVGLTKDTLIQMTELRRKGLENESAIFNKRVEKGDFKPFEEAARRRVEAVAVPPLPTSAAKGAARPTGVGSDWTLMQDAEGNSAWVSPDRKSFKEAK